MIPGHILSSITHPHSPLRSDPTPRAQICPQARFALVCVCAQEQMTAQTGIVSALFLWRISRGLIFFYPGDPFAGSFHIKRMKRPSAKTTHTPESH